MTTKLDEAIALLRAARVYVELGVEDDASSGHGTAGELLVKIDALVLDQGWKCSALTANMGPNDPLDCNWPLCGCDPYADKVLSALAESQTVVVAGEAEKIAAWLDSKDATYAASLIRRWYIGVGV